MTAQDWRTVPMPSALADRPTDARGFPITFVTLIGSDGRPDFTTLDAEKILACIRAQLCALCGTPLLGVEDDPEQVDVALIGGPLAIEHRNFFDPPMHEECAAYAMQVCPHIVIDTSRYKKQELGPDREVVVGALDERPDRFGMLVAPATSIGLTRLQGQPVFLVDKEAMIEVRWQGEKQYDEDGVELLPYFETRYFLADPHDDCEVEAVVVTRGRHRAEGRDVIAVLCPACATATTLTRVTDPDTIARITANTED